MNSMNNVKYNDFPNICRCCLRGGSIIFNHMFLPPADSSHYLGDDKGYAQVFTICTQLEIQKDDGFPHLICNQCTNQLWSSYSFRHKCQESAYTLSQIKIKHFSLINNESCGSPEFINCYDVIKDVNEPEVIDKFEPNVSSNEELVKNLSDFCDIRSKNEESKSQRPSRTGSAKSKHKKKIKNEDNLSIKELRIRMAHKFKKAKNISKDNKAQSKQPSVITKQLKKKISSRTSNIKYAQKKTEPQICPICGLSRISLSQHMATHSVDKPCKCEECGIFVKSPANLRKHMNLVHSENRPYKCNVCNMALKTANHLKRHTFTHTGERNFTCSHCGKAFIDADTRDRHQWLHNAERKMKCQYCGKLFHTRKGLLNHVGLHTGELPFKCGLCPKAFVNSQTASTHRRSHTIDQQFQCGTCVMRFKTFTLLKIHIKVEKHSLCFSQE